MTKFNPNARIPMPPSVRAYLRDWLAWVEEGAIQKQPYSRACGLCGNSFKFRSADRDDVVDFLLYKLFPDGMLPFNTDADKNSYATEATKSTTHLNPQRLAWARLNAPEDPS